MTDFIPAAVYALCFLTSAACAVLLARSYVRTKTPLVFWSALCFALLGVNNLLLVVDLAVLPEVDLRLFRNAFALGAVGVLLFGFIWNAEE